MDVYVVINEGHVVGISAKLQGAELIRAIEAKRITTSTTQLDELRQLKVRTQALPHVLDDAELERHLYDQMRIENHELQDDE